MTNLARLERSATRPHARGAELVIAVPCPLRPRFLERA